MPAHPVILPPDAYLEAVRAGYVRTQQHPHANYTIHNYTDTCTWDGAWNDVTMTCRGLITDTATGTVIARPFRKFFNHDQPQAPKLPLHTPVIVTDKADGSLGIVYPMPDGTYAIATRGSFTSDQATWATAHWREHYQDRVTLNPHWTYLVEIIYPDNRIVLDYQGAEQLILLGAVDTATGATIALPDVAATWPGPVVTTFSYPTVADALAAPARPNAEGLVLHDPVHDTHVKVKYDEYKRLHKILTGVTARHVWEVLASGANPHDAFAGAPDEFHAWIRGIADALTAEHNARRAQITVDYHAILASLPADHTRADFARVATATPIAAHLFTLKDNRDPGPAIWKDLKPDATPAFRTVSPHAD